MSVVPPYLSMLLQVAIAALGLGTKLLPKDASDFRNVVQQPLTSTFVSCSLPTPPFLTSCFLALDMPLAKRPQPPIGRDSKRPRPSLENASTPGRGATRKASPPSSPAFPDMTAAELELMNGLFAGIDAEVRCSPQKAALPLNRSPRKLSASPTKRPKPASSSLPRPKDAAVGSARIPLSPRKMNVPLLQGRKTTAAKPGGDQPRRKSADPMDFLGLAPAKRVAVAATRPPPKPSAPPPPKIFPPVQKPPTPKKTTVPPPPASVPSLSQESVEDYDGGWDMDALGSMDEAALLRGPEVGCIVAVS